MSLDAVNESIDKAKNNVKKATDGAAADLKKAREDGEAKISEAKAKADAKIESSKLPDPVKKAAKDANSAAHKAANEAVDKAKQEAKGAVEDAEKKANEAIDEAEKKAKAAVAKAEDKVKDEVNKAKEGMQDAVNDSKLPGPVKNAINKGLDQLQGIANKELAKLAQDANKMVGDLKEHAKDVVADLKDKALSVLGFEAAKKPADLPLKPPKLGKPANTSRKFDHQGAFRFRVELGGVAAGTFTAVDGLSAQVELIEYQGGADQFVRQMPGRPKVAPIVLKKGYINTSALWDWLQATMDGKLKLENVSVVLLADNNETELVRYNLTETWPSRWNGFQLDANSSNAMIEELELQARTISRVAA